MWKGEENFTRYFGLRGLKCFIVVMMNEINVLREQAGLAPYTLNDMLTKIDGFMEDYKEDDKGPDYGVTVL